MQSFEIGTVPIFSCLVLLTPNNMAPGANHVSSLEHFFGSKGKQLLTRVRVFAKTVVSKTSKVKFMLDLGTPDKHPETKSNVVAWGHQEREQHQRLQRNKRNICLSAGAIYYSRKTFSTNKISNVLFFVVCDFWWFGWTQKLLSLHQIAQFSWLLCCAQVLTDKEDSMMLQMDWRTAQAIECSN